MIFDMILDVTDVTERVFLHLSPRESGMVPFRVALSADHDHILDMPSRRYLFRHRTLRT